MSNMNRLATLTNKFQGTYRRVLCVCAAGLLRSPTAAVILSQPPFNFNTRAAGINDNFALVIADNFLVEWADEIVCMTSDQEESLRFMCDKPIICLDIEDDYEYRDPELIKLILERYVEKSGFKQNG